MLCLTSGMSFACQKGYTLQGGTGPYHKGGTCVPATAQIGTPSKNGPVTTSNKTAKSETAPQSSAANSVTSHSMNKMASQKKLDSQTVANPLTNNTTNVTTPNSGKSSSSSNNHTTGSLKN